MANYQSTHTGQEHDAYCTKSQLINLIYPVGAIYISVNSTSPQTLFGGTWQQISDTFLLAAGSTYSAGSTGGEATHVLTANEMPSHSHDRINSGGNADWPLGNTVGLGTQTTTSYATEVGVTASSTSKARSLYRTSNTGGGAAHNNMPPYLSVYMWKRTA